MQTKEHQAKIMKVNIILVLAHIQGSTKWMLYLSVHWSDLYQIPLEWYIFSTWFQLLYLWGIREMKYWHQSLFPIEKYCNNCKIAFLELAVTFMKLGFYKKKNNSICKRLTGIWIVLFQSWENMNFLLL